MVTIAWIEAGMSLKKKPAEKVKTKRQMPPEYWEVIYGNYKESLRLCFLPIDDNTQNGLVGSASNRKYKKQNQYSKPKE